MSDLVLNMNTPIIGILAGMGPRSTSPFIDLEVAAIIRGYRIDDVTKFANINFGHNDS